MPVQSAGEVPGRPTPEAATPLPSLQHRPQTPSSFKSLRRSHNEHTRAKRRMCEAVFLYPFRERAPVHFLYKSFSVTDCHSALSRTSHSTQQPRSLQQYSTLTAWERQTQRKKRGEKRGGEEGVTSLLSHCAICPALSMTGSLQREQLSICESTYSLSLSFTRRHYTLQILTSLKLRK